jgi:LmbE family N-acetylglucosaminyl deacetylase
MFSKKRKILVVAAHPDDEILGCGATMARLIRRGSVACTLILGEGITARDNIRNREKRKEEILGLKKQAIRANKVIGIKKTCFCDFPDNRFDSVPLLDIVKAVESIKKEFSPDMIFTHSSKDLNIDHRITYNAVLTAFRPVKGEKVREVYSFEVPSSTEWNYPNVFSPNMFVDISDTLEIKLKALKCYKSEMMEFPHPRSEASIRNYARRWGSAAGLDCAEAFEIIRSIL